MSFLGDVNAKAEELGFPFDSPGGRRAIAYVLAARTEEQHRRGVAEIVRHLYAVLQRSLPTQNWQPAKLYELCIAGPRRGAGTKHARLEQALDDAFLLTLNSDLSNLAAALAGNRGISLAAARKRLMKAERLTGLKVPRRRPFGRSSR